MFSDFPRDRPRAARARHFAWRRAPVALLAFVVLAGAACSAGTGAPTLAPAPSGGTPAACPNVPDPGNLPDWQPPSTTAAVYPLLINGAGELTCGSNRFLFTLLDGNTPIAAPDRSATIAIYNVGRDPQKPISTTDATFIWAVQDVKGIYVANLSFPNAGVYGAEITTAASGGGPTKVRTTFSVDPTSLVVRVGQRAPSTRTQTGSDVGGDLTRISTDATPDPTFYRVSEDAALTQHDPFVVIFATPKFCRSQQCGPTLDRIKPFAVKYPSIDFIHVEPYRMTFENGALQPILDPNNDLVTTDVTNAWGLTSEPWVFVVDRSGTITASLELIFSDAELTAALDSVK